MVRRILKAMIRAAREEYTAIRKSKRYDYYWQLYSDKWNKDLDWINEQIQIDQESNHWLLLGQEFNMWCMQAEPFTLKTIDELCGRRGFSDKQKQYIIDMTRHMGILISEEAMTKRKEQEKRRWDKKYGRPRDRKMLAADEPMVEGSSN